MELVVLSGKGGVGKTMVASSLALSFQKDKQKVLCLDADVDAPNLHLWLGGAVWQYQEELSLTLKAQIDQKKCIHCGKCQKVCFFGAIDKKENIFEINPFTCEGCGACKFVCPAGAISLKKQKNALFKRGKTKTGLPLFFAQLFPGESGSGKIVDFLKEKTRQQSHDVLLVDAPAGTGCPVIAATKDADFALLVTEPTPSGFADLKKAHELISAFKIPFGLVVNKFDINRENTQQMIAWAEKQQAKFVSRISYEKKVFQALSNLTPIFDTNLKTKKEIEVIYAKLKKLI